MASDTGTAVATTAEQGADGAHGSGRESGRAVLEGLGDLAAEQRAVLGRVLDGRWAHVRDAARARMLAEAAPPVTDLPTAEHRRVTLERLRALAEGGPFAAGFPSSVGGDGDIGGSVTAIEMLGHADLSVMVKAGVQWGLFGGAITALGTEDHHRRYLPGAMDLSLLGCFAMTESGHGSDVESLGTTATYDPATDEIVVHTPTEVDRKDYIGNAAEHGRLAVVFAQLVVGGEGRGVHAVVVPIRDEDGSPAPGVTISDDGRKGGLNGVDNGRLSFDHVRVPRSDLLDRYGSIGDDGEYSSPIENPKRRFFTMLGTLVRGRISVAGAAGAATQSALTVAIRYGLRRRQFERTEDGEEVLLLDYQAHQRRLLPALATTYALHLAQSALTEELHEVQTAGALGGDGGDEGAQRALETQAAGIKAVTTAHANATVQACREACGGVGFLSENLLVQLRADVDVFATFEGDNTVLLQLVGKGLLTGYKHHVGEMDSFGVARFVAEQMVTSVIERAVVAPLVARLLGTAPGRDGERGVFDRAWHLTLFEDREKHLLETLAQRLRAARGRGDAFEAFNGCQEHLLATARAHVHRLVLESFAAAVDRCEDDGVARLLDAVCDLYVLSQVEADRGWFLEHGRMTPRRAKEVTAAVDALCAGLRPYAGDLVDAFGIPEHLVAAAALADAQETAGERY
jgi:acyl-CoA oxidase